MKSILAIALIVSTNSAYRIKSRFATGMNGDEDLGEDIIMKGEPYHYHQKEANYRPVSFLQTNADTKSNSKWIELPDCGEIHTDDGQVALKADLSNAVFATCKSYNPSYVTPDPTSAPPPGLTREQIYQ